jgi:hypothetical protein
MSVGWHLRKSADIAREVHWFPKVDNLRSSSDMPTGASSVCSISAIGCRALFNLDSRCRKADIISAARSAQGVAAAPHRLYVILTARSIGEFLSQLADKHVDDL